MMSSVEDGHFLCARSAHSLDIHDCLNFSFSALRRLVESRLHLPLDFDDPLDPIPTRFRYLCLSGDVPSLSEQDRGSHGSQQTYQHLSIRTCGRISGHVCYL
jgi:hypothetical protein